MRSTARLPAGLGMYPQYLRDIGYYCTNNSKEDYNLEKPGQVWDESSPRAHWKNRAPGQPFFAVFNHTVTHESQIRSRPHTPVHDPAGVRVPTYHPDTPEVRQDWAQYYDKLTELDRLVGANLRELAEAGLASDTIVIYCGDHGPGMPRSKRWPYNSGLQVPLIVHIPEKFQRLAPSDYVPGGQTDRLVGFVDLAPTLLSLAGIRPPAHFQGHAFMGVYRAPPQPWLYGFSGRMDERYDMVRAVRDKRYVYIRNYMPHKIYGQHVSYLFQTPTTQVWKRLFDQGRLAPPQTYFWQTKPPEELYDLKQDPDEVHNLAQSPGHREVLAGLRQAQREWALRTRDLGFLPEHEIHARSVGSTPYEMARDRAKYPLERIMQTAELAAGLAPGARPSLTAALQDADSAVRYWAALGIVMRGDAAVRQSAAELRKCLSDDSPCVRVVAAQALAQCGESQDVPAALAVLLAAADPQQNGVYVALLALNALDELGPIARPLRQAIADLPQRDPSAPSRMDGYVGRLIITINENLQ